MTRPEPTPIRGLLLALLTASALLLAACGNGSASAANGGQTGAPSTTAAAGAEAGHGPVVVHIADFSYDPATITVSPGQRVTFTNDDETAHTATATAAASGTDGSFNTDTVQPGESASIEAPDQPGEYPFICSFHPFMKGTLVVR